MLKNWDIKICHKEYLISWKKNNMLRKICQNCMHNMISYILYTSRGRISILCAHFLFFCVRYICDTHIYTDVKNSAINWSFLWVRNLHRIFIFNLLFFSVLFSKHVEFFSCYFLTEKNDHWYNEKGLLHGIT